MLFGMVGLFSLGLREKSQALPELKNEISRMIVEIEPQLCGAAKNGHLTHVVFRI